jgi:hypothetical protein
MSASAAVHPDIPRYTELANKVFEPELEALGLSVESIKNQSLDELQESYKRVNAALASPDGFGEVKIGYRAEFGAYIAKGESDYVHRVGILPLLLERQKLILERIRHLTTGNQLETLQDLVNTVADETLKEKLHAELKQLREDSDRYSSERRKLDALQDRETVKLQQEAEVHAIQMEERKAELKIKQRQSWLNRDTVATVIGGAVLVILTVSLLIAMFTGVETTEIVNNGFLMLLGYFFAQAARSGNRDA